VVEWVDPPNAREAIMGVALLFVGYIQEAWPGTAGDNAEKQRKHEIIAMIGEQTDRALEALPTEDDWPPLCKSMFGWPPVKAPLIGYEHRMVHFAASMKNVDFALRDWLDKFESLLRKLFWNEAYVRVEQGYIGTHEFRWKPKKDWLGALYAGTLTAITDWDFTTTLAYLDSLTESSRQAS
jgi:hypothetical protein